MKYLEKSLCNEIREKFKLIQKMEKPKAISKKKKRIQSAIEKGSQIHSFRIEHPHLEVPFCVTRNKHKKEIKNGIKKIKDAFDWGSKNFNPNKLEENFIRELAGKITPELYGCDIAIYRSNGVAITGATTTPPYPFKLINYEIPSFITEINLQLKCPNVINHLETAIFAHLHIARMHPFIDGNGRTARILQDIILDHYGIPCPIIEAGERHLYYEILDKAVYDWKEKKGSGIYNGASEGESLFYTFIAGKINTSMDKILE